MATKTPNKGLTLPEFTDPASIITAVADNMTILDGYDPADVIPFTDPAMPGVTNLAEAIAWVQTNKVNSLNHLTSGDIGALLGKPNGVYYISPEVTGMPTVGDAWMVSSSNDGSTIAITAYAGSSVYYKYGSNGVWTDWLRLSVDIHNLTSGDISWLVGQPNGVYFIAEDVTGMPLAGQKWLAQLSTDGDSAAIFAFAGANVYYQHGSGGIWTGWVKLATAIPASEMEVPLGSGILAFRSCRFWKSQNNVVTLNLSVRAAAGSIATDQMIAALPGGYTPKDALEVSCTLLAGGAYASGTVYTVDGQIRVSHSSSDVTHVYCPTISFQTT